MSYRPPVCAMTREQHAEVYLAHRVRYLPIAIDNAERKLAALRNEALRYGLRDLAEPRP